MFRGRARNGGYVTFEALHFLPVWRQYRSMNKDDTQPRAPKAWTAAIAEARADMAARRTVDLASILNAYEREDDAERAAAARDRTQRPAVKA